MAGHQEMWLIQNGRVLAAAKHPDTGIHSVEAKMSMIQWSHPGSRSHFVDPPLQNPSAKAHLSFSQAPHFVERYHFVGINRSSSSNVSTSYMTPNCALNKHFSNEHTFPCGSHDWAQMAGHGMLLQNEGALLQFYKMEWNLLWSTGCTQHPPS